MPSTGAAADLVIRPLLDVPRLTGYESRYPRVVRVPVGWWDSPSAVCCSLSYGPQSARAARHLTRSTLRGWGRESLTEDAEAIVGELAANAVTHAAASAPQRKPAAQSPSLRLLCGTTEVVCAVLDPSDEVPVLKSPAGPDETGRGLNIVDTLSDAWGWSPIPGRGKAVWAVLFCARSTG